MPETRGHSPAAMVNVALRHIRLLVLVPLVAMILAGAVSVLRGSSYRAESTFKPESRALPAGGLAGMAATLGLDLGPLGEGESVEYYARLVLSREILTDLLRSEFVVTGESGRRRADLLTLYEIEGPTEEDRLWAGVDRLRSDISVTVDHAANVLTVQTTAPSPELAEQLNARLLELMNRFNLEKRQSRAGAERAFVEAQVQTAAAELAQAEDELAQFLAQNRRYRNSPELANEVERLRRRVDLRQQVYTSLAQSHEQAKLDEVRNTPVFTVLDRPEGSARETGSLLTALLMGLLLGLVLAGFWVFLREYTASQRARHPEDFLELDRRLGRIRGRFRPGRHRRTGGARAEAGAEAAAAPVASGVGSGAAGGSERGD